MWINVKEILHFNHKCREEAQLQINSANIENNQFPPLTYVPNRRTDGSPQPSRACKCVKMPGEGSMESMRWCRGARACEFKIQIFSRVFNSKCSPLCQLKWMPFNWSALDLHRLFPFRVLMCPQWSQVCFTLLTLLNHLFIFYSSAIEIISTVLSCIHQPGIFWTIGIGTGKHTSSQISQWMDSFSFHLDEVLVKNMMTGVNYIDTYHRSGLYPLPLPAILGR